jgi:hypothetical protein
MLLHLCARISISVVIYCSLIEIKVRGLLLKRLLFLQQTNVIISAALA